MVSKVLKWVTGGMEAILGFPIIGASIIIGFLWTPLLFMLILHIVTLVFSVKENTEIAPSILGIVTSCVGWIPFVGMTMHIITAILLMVSASKKDAAEQY
ncbi:hypothetical protein [Fervidibacillus halotolerans]|uniref:Uncharacterized protein n=1 Tax=Fervidibacillus halotolerans TaxID=2980027 RepID=A0A9E8LYB2_9BACI|nr:hypothetical protein [Fervidibacillus halotolerans]WAA11998.1 hypothetical protein OE105_10465 [Fervidibacillus halotolerans]